MTLGRNVSTPSTNATCVRTQYLRNSSVSAKSCAPRLCDINSSSDSVIGMTYNQVL